MARVMPPADAGCPFRRRRKRKRRAARFAAAARNDYLMYAGLMPATSRHCRLAYAAARFQEEESQDYRLFHFTRCGDISGTYSGL